MANDNEKWQEKKIAEIVKKEVEKQIRRIDDRLSRMEDVSDTRKPTKRNPHDDRKPSEDSKNEY